MLPLLSKRNHLRCPHRQHLPVLWNSCSSSDCNGCKFGNRGRWNNCIKTRQQQEQDRQLQHRLHLQEPERRSSKESHDRVITTTTTSRSSDKSLFPSGRTPLR